MDPRCMSAHLRDLEPTGEPDRDSHDISSAD